MIEEKKQHNLCGIYKITSPTGRIYIGQSSNVLNRWVTYRNSQNENSSQVLLYRSLNKHGVENHIFEIIEECEIDDLNCRERYWQDFYDVLNGGLNCLLQECGEKRRVLSQETRNNMSEKAKNKILTEEHRNKISLRTKGENSPMYGLKGENHPAFGYKLSEEGKKKLIENRTVLKGTDNPCSCEKSYNSQTILDKATGVFYYCIRELANLYGYNYHTLYNQLSGYNKNKTTFIIV